LGVEFELLINGSWYAEERSMLWGICDDGQISDADGAGWLAVIVIPDTAEEELRSPLSSLSISV